MKTTAAVVEANALYILIQANLEVIHDADSCNVNEARCFMLEEWREYR